MKDVRRVWLALLAAAIIAGAAVALVRTRASTTEPAVTRAIPAVPLVVATFGPYVRRVRAQGRIGAPSGGEIKLAFAAAGIVARLDVGPGDVVAAGQPLAELDPSSAANDLAQARDDALAAAATYGGGGVPHQALVAAQARLAAARERLRALAAGRDGIQSDRVSADAAARESAAKLDADGRALRRAMHLYVGGVVARKDVDAAQLQVAIDVADAQASGAKARSAGSAVGQTLAQVRADVTQAESDVASARAQQTVSAAQARSSHARYAAAQLALARTTLRATVSGIVRAVLKAPGEATDATQPAVVIGPAASSVITLAVSGADARQVQPGDPVLISTLGAGRNGSGRVRRVVRSVDPVTQTVTILVSGVPPGAVDGDAVDATIEVDRRMGVVIPTSAIVQDPGSGKLLVFIARTDLAGSEKFIAREISVESGDEQRTLVRTGLRAGERIAAQGAFDLLAAGGGG